jgi:hypothetical protein
MGEARGARRNWEDGTGKTELGRRNWEDGTGKTELGRRNWDSGRAPGPFHVKRKGRSRPQEVATGRSIPHHTDGEGPQGARQAPRGRLCNSIGPSLWEAAMGSCMECQVDHDRGRRVLASHRTCEVQGESPDHGTREHRVSDRDRPWRTHLRGRGIQDGGPLAELPAEATARDASQRPKTPHTFHVKHPA